MYKLVPVPFSTFSDTNYARLCGVAILPIVLYTYIIIKTPAVANIIVSCTCVTVIKI